MADRKGQPLRLDPEAKSADPRHPPFVARPKGAPVYYGFPVVEESETNGWKYGAISDYECEEPQHWGDGFVVAPDGSRAGLVWDTDTPDFYEIVPPSEERWGVYGVRFPRPVTGLDDLIFNFRSVLPKLQARFEELHESNA